jgi:EmrB/QacA subfamily drug resistance transporter
VATESEPAAPGTGAIGRQTWIAIGAMALAVFAIANDFTAMNVVLPALEQDLDTDLSRVQWVVNGYAIVFGVLIVPGGRLADLFGRKEMLALGAAIFAGFSFLGGLAPDITLLIVARILMGVGGALMWPAILGLMYAILPAEKAGLAGGLVIGVAGIGNAAGPVIAGALAESSWRYIFFLNLPIAAIAVAATWRFVHVERAREESRIDYLGTALLSLSLLSLLVALTVAPTDGYGSPVVLVGFVVSAMAIVGFVVRERSAGESGLVPPSLIANRPFLWACLAVLAMAGTFFATLFYLPQFFQKILGHGTLAAGVMLLPFVGVFALASFGQNWLTGVIGTKAVISLGATCLFVGPFLFVGLLDETSGYGSVVPGMVVLGVGVGLFYSAVTTAALTAVEPSRSSLAGGLLYMFQIAGGAVVLALTTTVFLATSSAEIDDGAQQVGISLSSSELVDVQGVLIGTETGQALVAADPAQAEQLTEVVRDAFVSGMRWAFSFDALLAAAGLAIALLAVGGPLSQLGRDRPGHDDAGAGRTAAPHHWHPHRHRHTA